MNGRVVLFLYFVVGLLLEEVKCVQKRCYGCKSRGELGSCRDPFNVTESEAGIHIDDCSSGWCAKTIESTTGAYKTDDYEPAILRSCLLDPPIDNKESCGYISMFEDDKPYVMCSCNGDLCNSAHQTHIFPLGIVVSVLITIYNCIGKYNNT